MTNDEAIKWLKVESSYIEENVGHGKEILEAYDMAIKALEQQPCEDCISRAEALHILECNKHVYVEDIEELPSVTPKPIIGRWLEVIDDTDSSGCKKNWHYKCSICGNEDSGLGEYNYCPICGAEMAESEV